jgi:hypothetical protein
MIHPEEACLWTLMSSVLTIDNNLEPQLLSRFSVFDESSYSDDWASSLKYLNCYAAVPPGC